MTDHDDDYAVTTQQFRALGERLDEAREAAKRDILRGSFAVAAKALGEVDPPADADAADADDGGGDPATEDATGA